MNVSLEKKQQAQQNLRNTCKIWAVLCPLLLIYASPPWFKAHSQIPIYHRDCRSTPVVTGSPLSLFPCYDETATAHLKSYYDSRGRHNCQDVSLDYPDGKTATMTVDGMPGTWWASAQVEGSCLAEVWHGGVTAVLRPRARILSQQNPELKGSTLMGFMLLLLAAGMIGFWGYLLLMAKQGKLFKTR